MNLKNTFSTITIYTTSDFPYGGAAENFVRQMAIGLSEYSCGLNVVKLKGNYYENTVNDTNIKTNHLLFKKRCRYDFFKIMELLLIIVTIPFSLTYFKIRYKSKIVLLYGIEYFYLVLPFIIFSKVLGIHVFRIITDRYTEPSIAPVWWKWPKLFFYKLQYSYIDKYLNGIICLSHFLMENAIKDGVLVRNICIIPHFINIEKFHNKAKNSIFFTSDKVRIGFCGTLEESNGLFVLLNAFLLVKKVFTDSELLLIGPIAYDNLVKAKKIISEISDSVFFVGRVKGEKVPDLLSYCSILVNPRPSGVYADAGFPTKLGEYFSTKKPVVATAVGDIKNYFVNKRELILVAPDSSEALAEGVLFLINNFETAKAIGESGYSWASENLDYKKNALKLFKFITRK